MEICFRGIHKDSLHWVWVWVRALGMVMNTASSSTIIEAAFGCLHNGGTGALGTRLAVVASIMVDGEAVNITIANTLTHTHTQCGLSL